MSTTFEPGNYVKLLRSVTTADGNIAKGDVCCIVQVFDQDGKSVEDYTIRSLRTGKTLNGIALDKGAAKGIWRMTLDFWQRWPDSAKGIVTQSFLDRLFPLWREKAKPYLGLHYTTINGKQTVYMFEGEDFIILPTDKEYETLAKTLLHRIDESCVRGFHPWYFSGSIRLDDQTLFIGTTRENKSLVLELAGFEKADFKALKAPYKDEVKKAHVSRISPWREKDVLKKTIRLFEAAASRKGAAA